MQVLGIQFALDDFGCGFASIGALRQFRFDRMKLDRSLVWGADDPGRGSGILGATIALAAALNIPVAAEGAARVLGFSLQDNPLLKHQPQRGDRTLDSWRQKVESWSFGWEIEDAARRK